MRNDKRHKVLLTYIAANVRRLRAKHGLTQMKLAEAADIDMRFLQKIEAAQTHLSSWVLLQLADAFGVAPGVLLRPATMPKQVRGRPRRRVTEPNALPAGKPPPARGKVKKPPEG